MTLPEDTLPKGARAQTTFDFDDMRENSNKGSKNPNIISRVVALEDLVLHLVQLVPWTDMSAVDRGLLGAQAAAVKRATFDTGWFDTPRGDGS